MASCTRDFNVTVKTGIVVPDGVVSSFVNPLAVYLTGSGIMEHVINNIGGESGTALVPAVVGVVD